MAPSTRGTKHICPSCTVKYYDLGRPDAACPKCGAAQPPAPAPRAAARVRRSAGMTLPK